MLLTCAMKVKLPNETINKYIFIKNNPKEQGLTTTAVFRVELCKLADALVTRPTLNHMGGYFKFKTFISPTWQLKAS